CQLAGITANPVRPRHTPSQGLNATREGRRTRGGECWTGELPAARTANHQGRIQAAFTGWAFFCIHGFVFVYLFDGCESSYGLVRGAVRGNVAPDPATWVIEAATLDAMDCSWCASGLFEIVNIQPPAASQSSRSCGVSSQTQ